jgi:transcriptional regulator with XRE-family HTH domain
MATAKRAESFAARCRRLRIEHQLTQGQLADLLQVTTMTVWRWEKGHHEPIELIRHRFDAWARNGRS